MLERFTGKGGWWVAGQLVLFVSITVSLLAPPAFGGDAGRVAVGCGGLLVALGAVQGFVAGRRLGHRLSPFPAPIDAGSLIDHGIYDLVRHPIYGGVLMVVAGVSLIRRSVPALLLCGLLAAFFVAKSSFEEDLLTAAYPEYAEYRHRVRRRMIPWVL